MALTKTAKAIVPVDTAQWGELMSSEAAQRLPKILGFIENFRLVYNDADGNGMALLILQGAKAFIPVIVKNWKVEPIDVIVYKKGSETKYGYLSERTLLKLLTSSSLGVPVGLSRGGRNDAYINTFSPAGGYGQRTSNPWAGGMLNKAATEDESLKYITEELFEALPEPTEIWKTSRAKTAYTVEMLKEHDYWRANESLVKWIDGPPKESITNYAVLTKSASGEYKLFSNNTPEGFAITEDQIAGMFNLIQNPSERMTKVANFETNRMVVMGNRINREGSVFIQPTDDSINTKLPTPFKPIKDGVFQYNGQAVYINPRLTYVNGEPSRYGLAVNLGSFMVAKTFPGFMNTNAPNSATMSREDFLVESLNPKAGDIITFYNRLDGTATVPVQIIMPMRDSDGVLSLRVKPLFGEPVPTTIKFFSGSKIRDNGTSISYPVNTTIIYNLPSKYVENFDYNLASTTDSNITVDISRGGSELFSIKENGVPLKNVLGFGEFVFKLIQRYNFSEGQALQLLERLIKEKIARITVPGTNNEIGYHPEINTNSVPSREKEALREMIKVASGLAKHPVERVMDNDLDITFSHIFNKLEKEAAVGDNPAGNEQGGYQPQGQAAQGAPIKPGGGAVMDMLANASPVAKATQEIIDQLTFYALGRFRTEEGITLITELEESLRDTENSLSKVLLLSQLGRIPGMDYSDSKILLSDIDSYMSRILSSRVLMK